MEQFPIVEILKVGFSGFAFLLALLGFKLYREEQKVAQPRERILNAAKNYMWICLAFAVLVGATGLLEIVLKRPPAATAGEVGVLQQQLQESTTRAERLRSELDAANELIASLRSDQLDFKQKVDLGILYSMPLESDLSKRRNSKKAREYLFEALADEGGRLDQLSDHQILEIVDGLVRIRWQLEQESDFTALIGYIEKYKRGLARELDLAKVYWASTIAVRQQTRAYQHSLEHFLRAASLFPEAFFRQPKTEIDQHIEDISKLISLLREKDSFLWRNGEEIEKALRRGSREAEKIDGLLKGWQNHLQAAGVQ